MYSSCDMTPLPREIVAAHSPDSDDAFMFYALATKKVRSPKVTFRHILEDIESPPRCHPPAPRHPHLASTPSRPSPRRPCAPGSAPSHPPTSPSAQSPAAPRRTSAPASPPAVPPEAS